MSTFENNRSLPTSFEPLAVMGVRASGAIGYALHEIDSASGCRRLKSSWGVLEGARVIFQLSGMEGAAGTLSFVFKAVPSSEITHELQRVARAIESVWSLHELGNRYLSSAAKVAKMEAELANSKIADRARGLLESYPEARDVIGLMERHVETVLRSTMHAGATLERIKDDLEAEISERNLASQAKGILWASYGLSEEEAHLKLREMSRQTRKPLREVANEVLQAR